MPHILYFRVYFHLNFRMIEPFGFHVKFDVLTGARDWIWESPSLGWISLLQGISLIRIRVALSCTSKHGLICIIAEVYGIPSNGTPTLIFTENILLMLLYIMFRCYSHLRMYWKVFQPVFIVHPDSFWATKLCCEIPEKVDKLLSPWYYRWKNGRKVSEWRKKGKIKLRGC